MNEKKGKEPEDRCDFKFQPNDFGADSWVGGKSNSVCQRSSWESHDETDRCIWQADVDEKPIVELNTARENSRERLDEAILRDLNVGWREQLSLDDCSLRGARFDNSLLRETDFSEADLRHAIFTDADFRDATFTDADLPRFNLPKPYLLEVDFIGATLRDADFTDARHIKADFTDADLRDAIFTDAELPGINLQDTDFIGADLRNVTFTDVDLQDADLTDANLRDATFTDTDLERADLSDTDTRGANFQHATLQDAVFTRTDCRGSTFTSALLYEVVFSDTRINSKTTFINQTTTFYDSTTTTFYDSIITTFCDSITSRPSCVYEENPLTTDHLPEDVHPLEAARWVYRRLETLHEDNALSEEARQFHISKEEAERALYCERGEYGPWGIKTFMWYFTRHGESVKCVLIWWGIVIGTAGILFPFVGGVKDSAGVEYALPLSPRLLTELKTSAWWTEILMNLYFSITTFSTIMDGGLAPVGRGTRVVVAVESIIGALLVALLVFVLGRRTAR